MAFSKGRDGGGKGEGGRVRKRKSGRKEGEGEREENRMGREGKEAKHRTLYG